MSGSDPVASGVLNGLTGVMFESREGSGHEFHGYVRIGGKQYKFTARREDNWGGRHRWVLKLAPHTGELRSEAAVNQSQP